MERITDRMRRLAAWVDEAFFVKPTDQTVSLRNKGAALKELHDTLQEAANAISRLEKIERTALALWHAHRRSHDRLDVPQKYGMNYGELVALGKALGTVQPSEPMGTKVRISKEFLAELIFAYSKDPITVHDIERDWVTDYGTFIFTVSGPDVPTTEFSRMISTVQQNRAGQRFVTTTFEGEPE